MESPDIDPRAVARAANALISTRLRAGHKFRFTVSTSSMRPALAPGDKVVVRSAESAELRAGDIVLRKAADSYIAHRLIGRTRARLVTKGDNALTADESWEADELIGVIEAIERAGQKKTARLTQARRRTHLIVLLSRVQLQAIRIGPEMLRRPTIKILRACLRLAVRAAR